METTTALLATLTPDQAAKVEAIVSEARASLVLPHDKKGIRLLTDEQLQSMGSWGTVSAISRVFAVPPAHYAIRDAYADLFAAMDDHARAVSAEQTRRARNATVAKNKAEMAASEAPSAVFAVGETVKVHAFGYWYSGVIKGFNKNGRAVVTYTSGTGATRDKTVSHDLIKKGA